MAGVSSIFRFVRLQKGLTQKEVAEVLEICKDTYKLKENKRNEFTVKEIIILCNLYNVTFEELYSDRIEQYEKNHPRNTEIDLLERGKEMNFDIY